ncbi:MAG TPA: hypothetical protein VHB99_18240, partial [Pirellulales bacterium]|nr:hypothetical protein [Pirellulales bacterium]
MADFGYLLSDELFKHFLRMRGESKRELKNAPVQRPQSPTSAPEIHVAVPPCGIGIPARAGDKPGHTDCCIYKLTPIEQGDPDYDPATAPDRRLEPIAIDADGNCLKLPVYNFSEFAVPARMPPDERYFQVAKSGTAWV